MKYFDGLLRTESEVIDSPTLIPAPARQRWFLLKEKWRDAVRNELKEGYEEWERNRSKNAFWTMIAQNYRLA
jgi:hypothetical protein